MKPKVPAGWRYDGIIMDVAPQYTCIDPTSPMFDATICTHPDETVEDAIIRAEVRFGIRK